MFGVFYKNRAGALKKAGMAFSVCVLFAVSDEFHQQFVPGRGPQVRDVFIDSSGAALGLLLCLAVQKLFVRFGKADSQ